ncbi:Histone deacetylase complex subunit SAP18 [Fusarium albosuccineum]|uniref:Histone deacetylase complex subunit SAP18 n=1 Tax=Fusarium albosuccineum TaxID=1237068 RepID=A0A8H4KYB5_9HYPO|nr:Histone deacetylase complex subunit SAP18 [Fusarium albosuccineum]
MTSPPPKSLREDTTPFLLQLFYRTGALHRPDEFASHTLPPHISVYTWSDCTLNELALELAAAKPSAFPSPAVGTRLVFQLVFPDLRNAGAVANSPPRFGAKDLGSIVIGENESSTGSSQDIDMDASTRGTKNMEKTLNDARFVVGDYISCAVLPPLSDGSVAPASSVRREPASAAREGRGGSRGGFQGRENGFGRGGFRGGRGGWRDEAGAGFPMGEWRRGEKLPDAPAGRSRGRGRW